jgi:hypothetical protein
LTSCSGDAIVSPDRTGLLDSCKRDIIRVGITIDNYIGE